MALLDRIRGTEYVNFGQELASSLKKDLPPALVPMGEAISATRVATILERAYGKAQSFAADKHPGFFRRAQLANAFKWRLDELGYDQKFIEVATEALVVYLTKKKS